MLFIQRLRTSTLTIRVLNTQSRETSRASRSRHDFSHRRPEAAYDVVIFGCKNIFYLSAVLSDKFCIQRLYSVNVDDRNGEFFLIKHFRRIQTVSCHSARSEDHRVCTLFENNSPAELE